MPRTRAALRLTDAYRREQVRVRDQAIRTLAEAWRAFDLEDIDASIRRLTPQLALTITAAKRANTIAAPAYLAEFVALELDAPPADPLPVTDRSAVTSSGAPMAEPISHLGRLVKWALGQRRPAREAVSLGWSRLAMIASSEILDAGRDALLEAMQADPNVDSYERVVWGTCGGCLGKQGQSSPVSKPLAKHPHCRCMTEPVVSGPTPDPKRVKQWTLQPTSVLRKHLANPGLHPQDRAELAAALAKKTGKPATVIKRPTGEQLFNKLPAAKQEATLGKAAAKAVRDGDVKLAQLSKVDAGRVVQRPLAEVLPGGTSGAVRATVDWAKSLWGTKTGPFFRSLSKAEMDAVTRYSGSDYRVINGFLRGKRAGSAALQRRIDALDSALSKTVLDQDVTVSRGTTLSAFGRYHPRTFIGKTITEPGYMSTSLKSPTEFLGMDHGVRLNIVARRGTRALYMEPVTTVKGEQEILFGRGTVMRVLRVRERKIPSRVRGQPPNTEYLVDVEIVGP